MNTSFYHKLKRRFYRYYCPFCNGFWRQFNEHGFEFDVLKDVKIIGGGRRRHVCPNCSSTDRLRMIFSFLVSQTDFFNEMSMYRVLHVAPERLLMERFRSMRNLEYLAVDKYNFGGGIIEADITNLEFDSGSFDLVICNHVLEHVDQDKLALSELHRVTSVGGIALLQVPYTVEMRHSIELDGVDTPEAREKHYGQSDHVRIYSLADFRSRLIGAGFDTMFKNPYKENWAYSADKLGLNKQELLLLVGKNCSRETL